MELILAHCSVNHHDLWFYYSVLMKYDLNKVILTDKEQEYIITLLELNECNPCISYFHQIL